MGGFYGSYNGLDLEIPWDERLVRYDTYIHTALLELQGTFSVTWRTSLEGICFEAVPRYVRFRGLQTEKEGWLLVRRASLESQTFLWIINSLMEEGRQ